MKLGKSVPFGIRFVASAALLAVPAFALAQTGAPALTAGDGLEAGTTFGAEASSSVLTRADVEATRSVLMDTSSVTSDADFLAYARGQMRQDEHLSRVTTSSDAVVLERARRARLFGLIPISIMTTTTLSADGTLEVTYPWFSFLLLTDEAAVKAALKSRVDIISGEVFSAASKARLLAQVEVALSSTTSVLVAGDTGS